MAKSDKYTSSNKLNSVIYSDFLNDLNPHPVVKDVVKYNNEYAITNAIKNLLMTNKGERLYQPDIGCNLNKMLFELMNDPTLSDTISTMVQDTIRNYEPRAKVIGVEVSMFEEQHKCLVAVTYYTINKQTPVTATIAIDRVR